MAMAMIVTMIDGEEWSEASSVDGHNWRIQLSCVGVGVGVGVVDDFLMVRVTAYHKDAGLYKSLLTTKTDIPLILLLHTTSCYYVACVLLRQNKGT